MITQDKIKVLSSLSELRNKRKIINFEIKELLVRLKEINKSQMTNKQFLSLRKARIKLSEKKNLSKSKK